MPAWPEEEEADEPKISDFAADRQPGRAALPRAGAVLPVSAPKPGILGPTFLRTPQVAHQDDLRPSELPPAHALPPPLPQEVVCVNHDISVPDFGPDPIRRH